MDIEEGFIDLGYELFGDKKNSSIQFQMGNVLEKSTVEMLQKLETWDIIYSSSVIHLLDKKQVELLLHNIYTLLGKAGIFFGQTTGLKEPQERLEKSGRRYYLHSKESLQKEFESAGFKNIEIDVKDHEKYTDEDKQTFYENRDTLFFYSEK